MILRSTAPVSSLLPSPVPAPRVRTHEDGATVASTSWWHSAEPPKTCVLLSKWHGLTKGSLNHLKWTLTGVPLVSIMGMWLLLRRVYQWKAFLTSTAASGSKWMWQSQKTNRLYCRGPDNRANPKGLGFVKVPTGLTEFHACIHSKNWQEKTAHTASTQSLSGKTSTVSVVQSLQKHILTIPVFHISS